MGKATKKISFVIPIYNEEQGIPELIKQLTLFINKMSKYQFEVIMVENGSFDNSFNVLNKLTKNDLRFKIVQLSKNFGTDGGLIAGIHYATGDACVIIMADLQEPIEIVKNFLEKWEKGYDIVYGVVKKRTASIFRNISSKLFYRIINYLTNNMFPQNASDFRLIDKKVYDTINNMPEQNKYLRGLIMWTGFKHIGIPFDREKRFAGESKADLKTVFKVALNGIFSFSYIPLRMVSILGLFLTGISFILIITYFSLFLVRGRETPGITTVILLLLFLFGILFFVLGIISEYLVRIYDEAKQRPTFIVKRKVRI